MGLLRRAAAALATSTFLLPAVAAASADARPLTKATWVTGTTVTEYYPAPEKWATGALVAAPGLSGRHRVDWLYSAKGLSMEGDGVGLDGERYHIENVGDGGWINDHGKATKPGANGWTHGSPFWRAGGYWLDALRRPTFPLAAGGWLSGVGRRYKPIRGITFAPGPSRPLDYYASVAVDPSLIPFGSRVFLPEYADITPSKGWFVAEDTGGAIQKRHVDVYRPVPAREGQARSFSGVRMRVIPPGAAVGKGPKPPARIRPAAG